MKIVFIMALMISFSSMAQMTLQSLPIKVCDKQDVPFELCNPQEDQPAIKVSRFTVTDLQKIELFQSKVDCFNYKIEGEYYSFTPTLGTDLNGCWGLRFYDLSSKEGIVLKNVVIIDDINNLENLITSLPTKFSSKITQSSYARLMRMSRLKKNNWVDSNTSWAEKKQAERIPVPLFDPKDPKTTDAQLGLGVVHVALSPTFGRDYFTEPSSSVVALANARFTVDAFPYVFDHSNKDKKPPKLPKEILEMNYAGPPVEMNIPEIKANQIALYPGFLKLPSATGKDEMKFGYGLSFDIL